MKRPDFPDMLVGLVCLTAGAFASYSAYPTSAFILGSLFTIFMIRAAAKVHNDDCHPED